MSLTAGLHYVVLFSAYAVLWFLCLFCLLPVGLGAERDPETGAPLNPMLKKKALNIFELFLDFLVFLRITLETLHLLSKN